MKQIHLDYLTSEQIELTEQLKSLKGADYYNHSIKIYDSLADAIKKDAELITQENGNKFFSVDIATIALKYNLNFKLACEFLEKMEILKPGTSARPRNFKVSEAMDAARDKNGWA